MMALVRGIEAGDEQKWRALWADYLNFYKQPYS